MLKSTKHPAKFSGCIPNVASSGIPAGATRYGGILTAHRSKHNVEESAMIKAKMDSSCVGMTNFSNKVEL